MSLSGALTALGGTHEGALCIALLTPPLLNSGLPVTERRKFNTVHEIFFQKEYSQLLQQKIRQVVILPENKL